MKKISVKNIIMTVLPVIVLALMIGWLTAGIITAQNAVKSDSLENLRTNIEHGITMCYAIEGVYPENIEYLTKNYGIIVDKDKYIVHYQRFADNIRPWISIIERG